MTTIYAGILFLGFPLYYRNSYLDILQAKTTFFVAVTAIYLAATAALLLWRRLRGKAGGAAAAPGRKGKGSAMGRGHAVSPGRAGTFSHGKGRLTDLFVLLLAAAALVSTFSSGKLRLAWTASEGKLFGAGVLLLCCGMYFAFSRTFSWGTAVLWCATIGSGAVFALAVLNRFGVDPLGMYGQIAGGEAGDYLSTIGQINILSGYICIFLPFFMGLFLYAKKPLSKLLYGACVVLGMMAGICSDSDSFFLGLAVALLFFYWHAFSSRERLVAFHAVGVLLSLAMAALTLCDARSTYPVEWREGQRALLSCIPWLAVTAGILVLTVFVFRRTKSRPPEDAALKKARNLVFGLVFCAFLGLGILLFLVNVQGLAVSETGIGKYLTFTDRWGTNRGYVWKRTAVLWKDLPLAKKICGVGLGGFTEFFSSYYVDSVNRFGYYFMDAHNEFLELLVTTGILGIAGYFGMVFSSIVRCLRTGSERNIVVAAVLLAALAQGIANSPIVFTTPFVFLFAAMAEEKE